RCFLLIFCLSSQSDTARKVAGSVASSSKARFCRSYTRSPCPGLPELPLDRTRNFPCLSQRLGIEKKWRMGQITCWECRQRDDGLTFSTEPGIRLAPRPDLPHMSLRVLAPTVTRCADGRWRMYFEARGPASRPTVICSAVSSDMLHWELEEGIRLQGYDGVGG